MHVTLSLSVTKRDAGICVFYAGMKACKNILKFHNLVILPSSCLLSSQTSSHSTITIKGPRDDVTRFQRKLAAHLLFEGYHCIVATHRLYHFTKLV